jgi:hypothetical protein
MGHTYKSRPDAPSGIWGYWQRYWYQFSNLNEATSNLKNASDDANLITAVDERPADGHGRRLARHCYFALFPPKHLTVFSKISLFQLLAIFELGWSNNILALFSFSYLLTCLGNLIC